MATKYCEFEPSQHRNKRVALMVFLDAPDDPHPLAICDVCAAKLKKMRPDAIVKGRKEFEAEQKAKRKEAAAKAKPAPAQGDSESSSSSSSSESPEDAPSSNTS
jgi:hypothetical protein